MGKKDKDKRKNNEVEFNFSKEIEKFENKFGSLLECIPNFDIRASYENALKSYNSNCGISPELYACNIVERMMLEHIASEIEENLDAEIALIDFYHGRASMILTKLGVPNEKKNSLIEELISRTIRNFKGENFLTCLVKEAKEMMNPTPKKKEVVVTDNRSTIEIILDKAGLSDVKPNKPNSLDALLKSLDIARKVSVDDDKFILFIGLKYGYYHEHFFSLEDIRKILNMSIEEVNNYYSKSLEYAKAWFGKELDDYYQYVMKKTD